MMRLNLQLFALNVDTSIIDYLKSRGEDSSYSARQVLADELGIKNYKGSGEQNIQMLKMLKNGTTPKTQNKGGLLAGKTPSPVTQPLAGNTPQAQPLNTPAVKGVDNSVVEKITAPFVPPTEVTDAQNKKQGALDALGDAKAPAINPEYLAILNTPFTASSAFTEANAMLEGMMNKIISGRTSYTDQIQSLMSQIQNRDKFSYDVDTDPLFQQALASAMGSGRQAMQDTMGQASALTGGYASTYAQSAGNQAYNAYIEDAYNNLPEYYQMALEAYNMEGQDMYNQLAMLNDADATEYGRLLDSYNISYTEAKDIYDREYGAYTDKWNNTYNLANLDLDQQGMAFDQAYKTYDAYASEAETLFNNAFDVWNSEVNNNTNIMNTQNNDHWNEEELDHDSEEAEKDRQHDSSENEKDRLHDSFENAFDRQQEDKWNEAEFNARYDVNGDNVVDETDRAVAEEKDKETLTNRELETFVNVVMSAENEEAGYEAGSEYLSEIGKENVDFAELDFAIEEAKGQKEKEESEAYAKLPIWEKNWEIVEDTYNGGLLGLPIFRGADHNDTFTDGINTYTYDQLKKMLKDSGLSKEEQKDFLEKLTTQSKK